MKRIISLCIASVLLAAVLSGCGGSSSSGGSSGGEGAGKEASADSGKTYTIKLAHQASETHPWQWSALKFKELVEERTEGKVKVDVYFGGTLGYDRDLIEGMQGGTVDMAYVTTAPLAGFVKDVGILDLPYVFEDWEHMEKFVTSDAAGKLAEKVNEIGLVNICFYPNGFRHVTNNVRPINSLEDLKGLKMRVMQSDVFIDTFNALGASAVPMGWSEVPTSLQQGTIDGQENGTITNYSNNIWEYQKYMSLTNHCAYMTTLIGSKTLLGKLPSEYYEIVVQAGIEATQYGIERIQEEEGKLLEEIKSKGMAINELDTSSLAEATAGVREAFTAENGGEIMDSIKALK
ncbi:TRAP transporter substrate-binding protein [Lachnospiraceae bacterium 62-35]